MTTPCIRVDLLAMSYISAIKLVRVCHLAMTLNEARDAGSNASRGTGNEATGGNNHSSWTMAFWCSAAQPLERPSRKRAREASSRCSEEDEGEEDVINPYVSDRERSDLLSDSENELSLDDDDDLKEPEAKKRSIRRSTEAAKLYVLKAAQE